MFDAPTPLPAPPVPPHPRLGSAPGMEPPVSESVTLHERVDFAALSRVARLALDPGDRALVGRMLRGFKSGLTSWKVVYKPSSFKEGRLYGSGLQCLKGWIRRILSHKYYHDIDIRNCAPTIIKQVWNTAFPDKALPRLFERYVENRSEVFSEIREDHPDLTDKQLKRAFLKGMHGGSYMHPGKDGTFVLGCRPPRPIGSLEEWAAEVREIFTGLAAHPTYRPLWDAVSADSGKTNKLGTFASYIWQKHENEIILCLLGFLTSTGLTVGVLSFDGLMVERAPCSPPEQRLDVTLLQQAECLVLKTTGFAVKLVEKSLIPTASDRGRLPGPLEPLSDSERTETDEDLTTGTGTDGDPEGAQSEQRSA